MTLDARLTTVTGKGVGRWRVYFRPIDMTEAVWAAKHLVATAQIRLVDRGAVVAGPMRADDFIRQYGDSTILGVSSPLADLH